MAVGIECPICEATFLVRAVGPKIGIRCPDCQRKFRYSEDLLADSSTATSSFKTNKPGTPPKPIGELESLATLATQADPAADDERLAPLTALPPRESNSNANTVVSDLDAVVDSSDSSGTTAGNSETVTQIRQSFEKRVKRQNIVSVLVSLLGLIAIAVLSVVLYQQLATNKRAQPTVATPSDPDSADDTRDPEEGGTVSILEGAVSSNVRDQTPAGQQAPTEPETLDDTDAVPVRVLEEDLPDRDFDYFKQAEIDAVWQQIRPRLLSLSVRTDLGNQPSVAMIVDSRGWALTSQQLVGKWPEVLVTAAAPNIDAYYAHVDATTGTGGQKLLTDQAKGLVGQDARQDLALLAVNSRFVISLDTLKILPRTRLVSGLYLVQAAPPSPGNPYGTQEIEVFAKQTQDHLDDVARQTAQRLGLTDPRTVWVVTSKKGQPAVGTPAIDRGGELAARYVFSTQHYAYFLPADSTVAAIQLAGESGTARPVRPSVPDAQLIPASHSMAQSGELMNRAGAACEQFSWLPAASEEFLQMQKFSRRMATVRKFIRENQARESESAVLSILSDHLGRWRKSISQSLGNPAVLSDKSVARLDELVLKQLARGSLTEGGSYIPLVAEVYSLGFDAKNFDSLILKIGDNQAFIQVPFEQRNKLLPGTLWLCFFKREKSLVAKIVELDSGETAPFYSGKLSLAIGPLEPQ